MQGNKVQAENNQVVVPLRPRTSAPANPTNPLIKQTRPTVFEFDDAIDFIVAALASFKARNSGFSQRALARILGISSPGFFNLVLNRKRPLNAALGKEVEKFFLAREILKPGEETYFRFLVKLGLCQSEEETKSILDTLSQLKHDREQYMISVNDLNVFHRWEVIALLEAIQLKDFQYNPQYLFKLFNERMPAHELVFMVEHLVRKGLLEHAGGTLRKPVSTLCSTTDIPNEQLRSLHRQFLLEAVKSLETTNVRDRDFNSYTMCVSKEKIQEAKSLIREFKKKLAHLMETPSGDSVYQLNIQFFPLLGADENDEA